MSFYRISPDPEIVFECDAKGCRTEYDTWYNFRGDQAKVKREFEFIAAVRMVRGAGWDVGQCSGGHYHLCPKHSTMNGMHTR